MSAAIIIGFRDRGVDPLRKANLDAVLEHWGLYPAPIIVVDDGRTGKTQFNRSAAYNRGAACTDADILIYTEADMLIHYDQIDEAVKLAGQDLGLVVPFTQRLEITAEDSELVRAGKKAPPECESSRGFGVNYGCVNVISRATLAAVGRWDETFSGWAFDDCAMWLAFNKGAGPTRCVDGPAYHLYHKSAVDGTPADKDATMANERRMHLYEQAKTPEQIRHLTAGGGTLSRDWRGYLR